MSWANDPPNPKIKDWNVTDLKVRIRFFCSVQPLIYVLFLTIPTIDVYAELQFNEITPPRGVFPSIFSQKNLMNVGYIYPFPTTTTCHTLKTNR